MLKEELLRYSRHIMLPEIDIEGQKKINNISLNYFTFFEKNTERIPEP